MTPTTACTAPPRAVEDAAYHESDLTLGVSLMKYCQLTNLLGGAGVSVPVGRDADGLPIGCGAWYQLACAAAKGLNSVALTTYAAQAASDCAGVARGERSDGGACPGAVAAGGGVAEGRLRGGCKPRACRVQPATARHHSVVAPLRVRGIWPRVYEREHDFRCSPVHRRALSSRQALGRTRPFSRRTYIWSTQTTGARPPEGGRCSALGSRLCAWMGRNELLT